MREDMYKVIVERPRRGKYGHDRAARRRNDLEGPTSLGMRVGYGYRSLNESLALEQGDDRPLGLHIDHLSVR